MKFNIDDYKGNYVMHCKTREEAESFCEYLHSIGKCWCNGSKYSEVTHYADYGEKTAYAFNSDSYTDVNWYRKEGYTILKLSDFMKFTKEDLKTGDVVKFRNGEIGIVNGELRTIIMKDKFACIHHFTEDLMYDGMNSNGEDIVAVRRPESVYHCQFCAFEKEYGILVYERKEVEEMTLAEICKLLGKEIKIVK